jgi:hypothetical protein
MQHARQPSRQPDPAPPEPVRARAPADASAPRVSSPARELQATLQTTLSAPAPEPMVASWPGWAKLVVLIGAAAVSWGVVFGAARALLDI